MIFLIAIIIIGFIALLYLFNKKFQELKKDSSLNILSQNVQAMHQRLDKSAEAIGNVARELGAMQEIGRDMKKLQDLFQSPKLRGNIGEQILRNLLEQILPKQAFKLQHQFRQGQIVDAIIKTSQGIVPIDSKFPIIGEFDQRQIKKHIDDIARKYILPQEGTVDFAVMYVPSESIYYELIIKHPDLLQHSYDKKVYFVSPNNFYYFLKIIMIGLEGAKIEEVSRKILAGIKAVEHEANKFGDELGVLLRHISNTKSASERVDSRFQQLSSKIDNIQMLQSPDRELLE